MSAASLFDKRFLIFSGKGGVGKSTVTAAFAVAAARRGKRVLIVEIGEHEAISRIFGAPLSGYAGRVVHRPGGDRSQPIVSMCITAPEALREYGMRTVKIPLIYNAVFDNPVVRYFTAAAPLLVDLNLLGKIDSLQREDLEPARGARFDVMLLDAPATGHAIAMFQAPQTAMRMTQAGPIYAMVEPMWRLLTDPGRTALITVCLPEEMPINEAVDLDAAAAALGVPRGLVIVNARVPDAFPEGETLLERIRTRGALASAVMSTARSTIARRRTQEALTARLDDAIAAPSIDLPLIISPRLGVDEIDILADRIEAEIADV